MSYGHRSCKIVSQTKPYSSLRESCRACQMQYVENGRFSTTKATYGALERFFILHIMSSKAPSMPEISN